MKRVEKRRRQPTNGIAGRGIRLHLDDGSGYELYLVFRWKSMRMRYYFWFGFGWFALLTLIDGIWAFTHEPGRVGPIVNAVIFAMIGGFVTVVLAAQMLAIVNFHRAWFQVPDTFAAPLCGGIFAGAIFFGSAWLHPALTLGVLFLPLLPLWIGSVLVSALLRLRAT